MATYRSNNAGATAQFAAPEMEGDTILPNGYPSATKNPSVVVSITQWDTRDGDRKWLAPPKHSGVESSTRFFKRLLLEGRA
jgi:hypothetical protein